MALLSCSSEPVGNASLDKWETLDSGGFGHVFKARHKDWGFDVAIKILHDGVGSLTAKQKAVYKEASHMEKGSCEFVPRIYGIYQGCPPFKGMSEQQGIMMEFMGGGSIQSLQKDLCGPPPWPLAFRLVHQVALAMNFLHSRKLIHQDLKPNNVLLSDDLNAKLADFGLSMVSTSALSSGTETTGDVGGSYKYMPPEAFDASYQPVRAFDTYSYGILIWSIVTGKDPYPAADYKLVALRIPKGDRPPCKDLDHMRVEGLKELVDLMKKCWDENPSIRPTFKECLEVTECVLSRHRNGIHDAVHQVLTRRKSPTGSQHSVWQSVSQADSMEVSSAPQTPEHPESNDTVDNVMFRKTQTSPIQDSVSVSTRIMTTEDKAKFIDDNMAVLIQDVSEVMALVEELGDMVHPETYSDIEAKATSQGKMRVLYRKTFRSGGEKVKAAFFDVLKKHHRRLVERLGG